MIIVLYLVGFVTVLGLAIAFLVRYTNDVDSDNASSDFKFLAHDSTNAAYARRAKEIARELDEEAAAPPASVQPKPTEPREERPETRTGG